MKPQTKPQKVRQQIRSKGKYSKYHKCEVCNKILKGNEYWSDPRCNTNEGYGQILCQKCASKVRKVSDKYYKSLFMSIQATHKIAKEGLVKK